LLFVNTARYLYPVIEALAGEIDNVDELSGVAGVLLSE
jgi:hypothetical protein